LVEAKDVWAKADMVMKVKEPISSEYGYFRKGLVLFTYLHLAAEPELAKALVDSGVTAIGRNGRSDPDASAPDSNE
jgi:alanine dehydrogenase